MSHLCRTVVPNSWDDDDWIAAAATPTYEPQPPPPPIILASNTANIPAIAARTASPFHASGDSAVIVTPATQQPKSFYKPELTILKRASPSALGTPPAPPGGDSSGTAAAIAARQNGEKERKEKERRERERRYQEAKDRIFASDSGGGGTATPPTPDKKNYPTKSGRNSGQSTPGKPSPRLNASIPLAAAAAAASPKRRTAMKAPPAFPSSGAITGFSLNSGSLSAAPVRARERQEWQLRQVALDGKMLESQAERYGFGQDEEPLGDRERGLDWDEFRRDRWTSMAGCEMVAAEDEDRREEEECGEIGGRLAKLDFIEVGESADERLPWRDPAAAVGLAAVVPLREPRGPDREGRGFVGRGRGSSGRARAEKDAH